MPSKRNKTRQCGHLANISWRQAKKWRAKRAHMQRADVLHCVMRPTAVCRGSSVYRRVQPAICIWHPQGRLPRLSTFFVFVGNSHNLKIISSSFEVIRAPDQLLTTSRKRKMPPCTQEKTFSLEESCFAYLEGALCYLCVRETHLATSSLPLQRPWHCPTSISFGTGVTDPWGTTAVELLSSAEE